MMERVFQENVDAQNVRLSLFLNLLRNMFSACDGHYTASTSLTLLFASVLKVEQAGRTVQMIATKGYVDEVLSISRTLVEVTVNAAYFQYASPAELNHFIRFQPEFDSRQRGGSRRLGRGKSNSAVMSIVRTLVGKARQPNSTEPTWTRATLLNRAQFTDQMSQIPIMTPLVERCHPRGHAAVHGTMGSLETFIAMLTASSAPASDNQLVALAEAVFVVNLCLLTLCMYLNAYLGLGMDEAIDEAAGANSRTRPSLLTVQPMEQ